MDNHGTVISTWIFFVSVANLKLLMSIFGNNWDSVLNIPSNYRKKYLNDLSVYHIEKLKRRSLSVKEIKIRNQFYRSKLDEL